VISTLIALPYEIARLPLVLVDETLAGRLSEASPPRVTLERTLGSADRLAGMLLRNREISARGASMRRRRCAGRLATRAPRRGTRPPASAKPPRSA
jgi:hypothetical protein